MTTQKVVNKGFLAVLVASGILVMGHSAYAQDGTLPRHFGLGHSAYAQDRTLPRHFGLGITTLKEHGFGGYIRGRIGHFAIDGSISSLPVFVVINNKFHGGMSLHLDGSAVIFFSDTDRRFQNGIRLGGVWDSILGPGGMAGWIGDLCWERFVLGFGAGVQFYPEYDVNIKRHFDLGYDVDITFGAVQPYIGINIGWYLF